MMERLALQLNQDCACEFLDRDTLFRELSRTPALSAICQSLQDTHPHLFSASNVFVSTAQVERMTALIDAVEQVVNLPVWRSRVLHGVPAIAQRDPGSFGGLLGFDFHLTPGQVSLIEININPGGALLNVALARAQKTCCTRLAAVSSPGIVHPDIDRFIVDVFAQEWQAAGRSGLPGRLAIVDDQPSLQYLYPEFLLYQELLNAAGIDCVIADPKSLTWDGNTLRDAAGPLEFVYNRLTDFNLAQPAHTALRQAYEQDALVMSPHPRAHAIYANKRNLVWLSDESCLSEMAVPADLQARLLEHIPKTVSVTPATAEDLWARRKSLFFKPYEGFGSRATYRGDKLTRRVWQEIQQGDYVAQEIAPPGERLVPQADGAAHLKLDIRAYAYRGHLLLLAARLYAGQTTNFRSPGGGFAPVWELPHAAFACHNAQTVSLA